MTKHRVRLIFLATALMTIMVAGQARRSSTKDSSFEVGVAPSFARVGSDQETRQFVAVLLQSAPPSSWSGSFQLGNYLVTFAQPKGTNPLWRPDYFDVLIPASDVPGKELRSRIGNAGIGVPYVGVRVPSAQRPERDPFLWRGASIVPVTIECEFWRDGENRDRVLVQLWNPLSAPGIVAADFSAPTEFMLSQAPSQKHALLAFFNPGEYEDAEGLFMAAPYQPGKIPVVMVHGLDSLPRTWMDVYNELIADPCLRARYQFWFFRYATGQPVAISSMELRNALQNARSYVDPKHKDKALDRMVLIGHSMGGLLTRMMVTESGDQYWNALSNVPLESASIPLQDRAYLQNLLFFHPQPYVKRVVFISTPHRGSTLASGSLGQLAGRIVKTPGEAVGIVRRTAAALPGGLSSGFGELVKDMPTSIDNLSPNNRFVQMLQTQPIYAPHHSIIGTQGVTRGGKPISDGVVPYWSSHLDSAESEVWINSGHSAHQRPEAISELHRILLLHLNEG